MLALAKPFFLTTVLLDHGLKTVTEKHPAGFGALYIILSIDLFDSYIFIFDQILIING